MSLRVSGKNISVGAALQERISGRVADATAKYFRGEFSGFATVGRDGFGFRGASIEAEGSAPDAYESADQAALRIEKRLRRYKRRRKDSQARRGRMTKALEKQHFPAH